MTTEAEVRQVESVERKFDSTLALRPHAPWLAAGFSVVAVAFAIYHYVTAGTGVPVDYLHMGVHLAGLSLLVFTGFPFLRRVGAQFELRPAHWTRPGNVPLIDWALALIGIVPALYLSVSWQGLEIELWGWQYSIPEQALRQGDPVLPDLIFGTILVVLVLEMARRSLGAVLPSIVMVFIAYALLGPWIPVDILRHPGVDWRQFINNMYFPQEGIFGVTLWVVSTVVFHFVLFGVVAQRMGLGKFFVDNATILAGRYAGGPAKVSVVSSAFFGTISGSSIANTVSTGSLTIPNMKRLGYPGHFAGGVEAASSAGGQITPPIMGAASFLMAEFLEIPYTHVVIAALIPAAMHYVGVMAVVHFTARRLGLKGMSRDQLPQLVAVWRRGWPTVVPLIVLIYVLFSGFTPYLAAFCGISACIIIGFLNPMHRITLRDLWQAFEAATRYALAVGAAAAAVGIVVGVINTTGVAFRLGFMVTGAAHGIAEGLYPLIGWMPFEAVELDSLRLFISLLLIAIACILMGAGLPTTALYIMLVSVAQPALAQLGVVALASHMFVLYYGVVSEITPPVCASAYAAAGIAGANPFRTGLSAFSLGLGKLLVPMVFVYTPVILLVATDSINYLELFHVVATTAVGVFGIGMAVAGYCFVPLTGVLRFTMLGAGLMMVGPGVGTDVAGLTLMLGIALFQRSRASSLPVNVVQSGSGSG